MPHCPAWVFPEITHRVPSWTHRRAKNAILKFTITSFFVTDQLAHPPAEALQATPSPPGGGGWLWASQSGGVLALIQLTIHFEVVTGRRITTTSTPQALLRRYLCARGPRCSLRVCVCVCVRVCLCLCRVLSLWPCVFLRYDLSSEALGGKNNPHCAAQVFHALAFLSRGEA